MLKAVKLQLLAAGSFKRSVQPDRQCCNALQPCDSALLGQNAKIAAKVSSNNSDFI